MCGFIGTVNQKIPNFESFVKKLSHRGQTTKYMK